MRIYFVQDRYPATHPSQVHLPAGPPVEEPPGYLDRELDAIDAKRRAATTGSLATGADADREANEVDAQMAALTPKEEAGVQDRLRSCKFLANNLIVWAAMHEAYPEQVPWVTGQWIPRTPADLNPPDPGDYEALCDALEFLSPWDADAQRAALGLPKAIRHC